MRRNRSAVSARDHGRLGSAPILMRVRIHLMVSVGMIEVGSSIVLNLEGLWINESVDCCLIY